MNKIPTNINPIKILPNFNSNQTEYTISIFHKRIFKDKVIIIQENIQNGLQKNIYCITGLSIIILIS